jgi:hypothetical protein
VEKDLGKALERQRGELRISFTDEILIKPMTAVERVRYEQM